MNCKHENDCGECQDRDQKHAEEVDRLRALIKAAEEASGDMSCPWCDGGKPYSKIPHTDDCPAFTPSGVVK